jgi:hypothetical protein
MVIVRSKTLAILFFNRDITLELKSKLDLMVSFEVEASGYVKDPGCIVVEHNFLIVQGLGFLLQSRHQLFEHLFYY